ncbi:MAG: CBS domain-containing protein, partial [Kordiimonadaceae bacterium]|nr:CBS domain-containing protein [Kordiimonadaceae bacterium]
SFLQRLDKPVNATYIGTGKVKEVKEAIEEHEDDTQNPVLGDTEREILFNVLEYGALRVDDVMVPRADIIGVPGVATYKELVSIFADAEHSRIPVFRDTLDDVLGMVHVKDVLKVVADGEANGSFRIGKIRRPVLYVPPSMKAIDLLAKMKKSRTHMAIVVDEYGGTDGLVTVEDIVEEIVGEIEDEHDDVEEPELMALAGGGYDADARLEIEEMEKVLGVDILPEAQDEDVATLGGLVFTLAGCVPEIGEVILHETGYKFEILDADPRRISKVRIHPPVKE